MYYGFHHYSKDKNVRSQMSSALQYLGAASTDYWAGWKRTADGLDLYNFDYSPVTQQLVNHEKRQIIVSNLWLEIQSFIQESVQALQQVFGADFELIKFKTDSVD